MYDPETTARLNDEAAAREERKVAQDVYDLETRLDLPHCDPNTTNLRNRLERLRKLAATMIDTRPFEVQKQPIRLGDWLASH